MKSIATANSPVWCPGTTASAHSFGAAVLQRQMLPACPHGERWSDNISILSVSAAAFEAHRVPLPGSAPHRLPKEDDTLSHARVAFSPVRWPIMSDAQHVRPDLSSCLEWFSDLARCMPGRPQTSRTKENPSNDHLAKNTAAGLLGPSEDEARVRPGRMLVWLGAARRSSPRGGEDATRSSK